MEFEKYEDQLAVSSHGGREGLAIWHQIMQEMPGEQKVAKSFELTELTREIMRAGIRDAHPHASEEVIQQIFVDRLLSLQGISLDKLPRSRIRKNSGPLTPPFTQPPELLRVQLPPFP
jgi:hypothetical protein